MSKFISIDLDPQGIFAVGGSARAGHAKVDHALAWDGTDGEAPAALTAETAKQLGEKLRERLSAAGISPAPVVVSIPRDRVILKELRYPTVPRTEEPMVVRFQALKELSDAAEDVVLDYVPLATGTVEGERHSMAFVVRKEFFNAIQAFCTAANLKLAAVTPRPYCVAAGLMDGIGSGSAPRPENRETLAVLTLGPGGGEFIVFRSSGTAGSNEILFARTIPAHSISSETMLLAEVRRNLTMYAGSNPAYPVQALYVADSEGRTANRLRNSLGISVHAYNPLAGLTTTVSETSFGRFASAVGLLALNSLGELPINFVTPRQPKPEKDPKQKQMIIGGVATLLLVVGLIGFGMMRVASKEQELAELQNHKADLEKRVSELEPEYKRVAAAKQWQAREVVWLDMLYDVHDQFRHSDNMVATKYVGKAIQPDSKTGKQEAQAQIDLTLNSRSPVPVNALMAAMDLDNRDPRIKLDPKTKKPQAIKFYLAITETIGGPPSGDNLAKEYIIHAKATHRDPANFTRLAQFTPPNRKNYPPIVVRQQPQNQQGQPGGADDDLLGQE